MKLKQAITLLQHHQEWRTGKNDVQTDPVELTTALQTVIDHYQQTKACNNCKCKK